MLFGRRMLFEKPVTNRAGTLFLRIVMKMSFCFIRVRRASTQRFSATFPCLIPIPYGPSWKRSSVSFAVRSAAATPTSTVSSHISASARPWLKARSAFVKLSVTITWVLVWQRFIQRS